MSRRSSGEGSIGKRKDGTYYAALQVDGKRKWIYGKTRKEVADKLAELRSRVDQGANFDKEKTTVAELLGRWMESIVTPRSKAKTAKGYQHIIDLHLIPGLGNVKVGDLDTEKVQRVLNDLRERGFKPRTVRNVRAVLRQALGWALKAGYVTRNPAALSEAPRIEAHRLEPLTLAEARRFLASVKGHPREMLYQLAFHLGMRQGELLALRHDDIRLAERHIYVTGSMVYLRGTLTRQTPKTAASYRLLPLPANLAPALQEHLNKQREAHPDCSYIFSTEEGEPFLPYKLLYEFQALLKAAKLRRVRFHDVRHTAATLLLSSGFPVRTVADILGHANVAVTLNTYAHSTTEQAQEAVDTLGSKLML
jgi:integrase